jgi:2-polyprenyl-3-methyl-5-hydroxy-6-metoxy-1,4-benzoquinol methylase
VIESGILRCDPCTAEYKIHAFVPRFVPDDNYNKAFGYQWTLHGESQFDSITGKGITEKRFFEETKWDRDLSGQSILEVGCGGGRFTRHACETGATVIAFDASCAVDSNQKSNGHLPNLLIVQADMNHMPFKKKGFDKLFCFGVMSRVPDPKATFFNLVKYVKSGGLLALDIYKREKGLKRLAQTKFWVRPITKNMQPERLYRWIKAYVYFMWPLSAWINKIPRYGTGINWAIFIADYRGRYDLPDETLREWAVLDTFNNLAPTYDNPKFLDEVQGWFDQAGLSHIDVKYGYNGIEGRAKCDGRVETVSST